MSAADITTVRSFCRARFWTGHGRAARLFRELLDAELVPVAGHVVQVVYEFAGPKVLERLLAARLAGRGLRTPRPIAEQVVERIPHAVLVPLPRLEHSAMDIHQLATIHVAHAVAAGRTPRLPELSSRIAALPRKGASSKLGPLISAGLRIDLALPTAGTTSPN